MIQFPEHKAALMLSHNDHLNSYETVEEHLENLAVLFGGGQIYRADEWVSEEDFKAAIRTGELWELQWYPRTPVGFCRVFGSTLETCLEASRK